MGVIRVVMQIVTKVTKRNVHCEITNVRYQHNTNINGYLGCATRKDFALSDGDPRGVFIV